MILVDTSIGRYLVSVSYSSTAIWALTEPWMIGSFYFLGQQTVFMHHYLWFMATSVLVFLGHLLVGEGLPGLLRGVLGMIELVSSYTLLKT